MALVLAGAGPQVGVRLEQRHDAVHVVLVAGEGVVVHQCAGRFGGSELSHVRLEGGEAIGRAGTVGGRRVRDAAHTASFARPTTGVSGAGCVTGTWRPRFSLSLTWGTVSRTAPGTPSGFKMAVRISPTPPIRSWRAGPLLERLKMRSSKITVMRPPANSAPPINAPTTVVMPPRKAMARKLTE